jgi:uncharacterized protein (TIGR00730 family)
MQQIVISRLQSAFCSSEGHVTFRDDEGMITSVAVFCGSSEGRDPRYSDNVDALAHELVARNLRVVFGGARVGAMGVLADAVLRHGGEIIGVMPQQLADYEIAHQSLSDLHVVGSMHERKARIAKLSDGFVALPGGFGTLDEFAEILTWAQLGIHHHPTGVLNTLNYFDSLLQFFDHAVAEHFLRSANRNAVLSAALPGDLLDAMQAWLPANESKWLNADGSPMDLDQA